MTCPTCDGKCGHEVVVKNAKNGQGQPARYAWWGCDTCDQTGRLGASARRVAMILPKEDA
jgi:hypothetical protein